MRGGGEGEQERCVCFFNVYMVFWLDLMVFGCFFLMSWWRLGGIFYCFGEVFLGVSFCFCVFSVGCCV